MGAGQLFPATAKFLSNLVLANKRTSGVTRVKDQNLQDKLIVHPGTLGLTNASAQTAFTVALADGEACGGTFEYEVDLANSTSQAVVTGVASYVAQRTGATTTGAVTGSTQSVANTGATAGTVTLSFADGGSGVAQFKILASSTIATPTVSLVRALSVRPTRGSASFAF
jgi:hypothetical protein